MHFVDKCFKALLFCTYLAHFLASNCQRSALNLFNLCCGLELWFALLVLHLSIFYLQIVGRLPIIYTFSAFFPFLLPCRRHIAVILPFLHICSVYLQT